jgi:hypothetical protein
MGDEIKSDSVGVPRWVKELFGDFLDHIERLFEILHLSMHGISVLRGIPNALEVLQKLSTEDSDVQHAAARLERAKKEAKLAETEVADGFPLLHAQASIALWGALESLIRTFFSTWIRDRPQARDVEELKRVKIRWAEYEALSVEDRSFYLIDLLEESMGTRRAQGIGRFEALFRVFGLSSEVDESIEKNLFELYHVRNVFVHRRGIADWRIVQSCPWLGLSIGSPVVVKHDQYGRYHEAAAGYLIEIIQRSRVHFGLGRDDEDSHTFRTANRKSS